tara:strand:+ start:9441 stop:10460 length:1020 start_codon:yes stop_codon:yes gene_type:complete
MSKLIVNASNCHSGGGKTLIVGFLKGVSNDIKTIIYVDDRLEINFPLCNSIQLIKISRYKRFLVGFMIKKILKVNDKILYFGNLPPYLKFNCNHVILQLSSRFYVDSISMKGFKWRDIGIIYLEKLYYKLFIKNVSQVIVQTSSMYNKLIESGFQKKISIWAVDDLGDNMFNEEKNKKDKNSFIYVASLNPYKNHKRLLNAWNKLKNDGISPKLYLTLDDNVVMKKWIKNFVLINKLNVVFLENISREELLSIYSKVEVLIFPSLFESYGLPLIEAKKFKMKIIASDLDYCWDFIEPDEFFNPYDVDSITRSLKRFLKKNKKLDIIYSPNEFFNKIIDI